MSRGRQTAIQIVDEIARLTADGYGPSQIFRDLEKRTWLGCEPVSRRTVQEIARVARGKDPTAPWSFVDTPSDDARLVLDVLSPIVRRTDGRVWFSKDLAGWVVPVRRAGAPTMPPDWVHLVRRMATNGRGRTTTRPTRSTSPWPRRRGKTRRTRARLGAAAARDGGSGRRLARRGSGPHGTCGPGVPSAGMGSARGILAGAPVGDSAWGRRCRYRGGGRAGTG